MSTRNAQEKLQLKSIIKETILEVLTDDVFINKIAKTLSDKVEEKIKKMEDTIRTMEHKTADLEKHIDILQQNEKINNICIYGVKEQENEKLKLIVTQLINANTEINLNDELDIEKCYRIGKESKNHPKPRPVVKFKKFEQKIAILKNRNKFKGKQIFIAEDLTQVRLNLLQGAKTKLGGRNVWSYNGHIFAKINGSSLKIRSNEDLLMYSQD